VYIKYKFGLLLEIFFVKIGVNSQFFSSQRQSSDGKAPSVSKIWII